MPCTRICMYVASMPLLVLKSGIAGLKAVCTSNFDRYCQSALKKRVLIFTSGCKNVHFSLII